MAKYEYPFRVLEKKFRSKNHKPFVIDCANGKYLQTKSKGSGTVWYRLLQTFFVLVALTLLWVILLEPVTKTTISKYEVNQILTGIGVDDANKVKLLKQEGRLVSESADGNQITLIMEVPKGRMTRCIELAFSIESVKGVITDGKTLSVTFLSAK